MADHIHSKIVSVVIPCRNEEKHIALCIESILSSNYPNNLIEVIVVDGMSEDNTIGIVKDYTLQASNVKLLKNTFKTTQFALNIGIQESKGDIVIILGAHAALGKEYISECVRLHNENPSWGCVGGLIENVYENDISKIIGYAMSSSFGVGNAHFRTGNKNGFVDTVAFGAYKKEVFEKIGYFDEELPRNQDDEFNFRLIKNNFPIFLDTNLKLLYYTRASFKKLFMQYYQYGYWKVFVNKKHKTITTVRQVVPALFVFFIMGGLVLSFFSTYFFLTYLFILLTYIFSAIYSGTRKTSKIGNLFVFLWVCFLLHSGYGSGYIMGIIRFVLFRKKPAKSSSILTR